MKLRVNVEITEADLRKLIAEHIGMKIGHPCEEKDVVIEVKTKANWKAEWERGDFRARFNGEV